MSARATARALIGWGPGSQNSEGLRAKACDACDRLVYASGFWQILSIPLHTCVSFLVLTDSHSTLISLVGSSRKTRK